jgi:hypothetical protein
MYGACEWDLEGIAQRVAQVVQLAYQHRSQSARFWTQAFVTARQSLQMLPKLTGTVVKLGSSDVICTAAAPLVSHPLARPVE